MKYISCRSLQHELHFFKDQLKACCSIHPGHIFIDDYKGVKPDWQKIQQERKDIIENCKQGIIPTFCNGCYDLEEKEWEETDKIERISINHWIHCNCGCKYCVNIRETQGKITAHPKNSPFYKIYPLIKDLIKNDMLSKNLEVICMGGECGVLSEFEKVMNLLYKNGVQSTSFMTSGIKYIKAIEKSIKTVDDTNITISIDCGCRETYKKIKRVDKYNDVVKNIKRYIKHSKNNGLEFVSKYIIVENLNDNIEEIEKWLMLNQEIGIKNVRLDIDYQKIISMSSKAEIPGDYRSLIEHFNKKVEELNLNKYTFKFVEELLEKGYFERNY